MKRLSRITLALICAGFASELALRPALAAEAGAEGSNSNLLRLEKLVAADPRACTYRPQPAVDIKPDLVKAKTCKPGERQKIVTPRFAPAASADGR